MSGRFSTSWGSAGHTTGEAGGHRMTVHDGSPAGDCALPTSRRVNRAVRPPPVGAPNPGPGPMFTLQPIG